jgi:hypothetical protein
MKHFVTTNGTNAVCVCGYSVVATTPEAVEEWRALHYFEFRYVPEPPDSPVATRQPCECCLLVKGHATWCRLGMPGRQPHHLSPNGSLVQLIDATDDQLRAECERRGFDQRIRGPELKTIERLRVAEAERDQWEANANAASMSWQKVQRKCDGLRVECDEWKRKAEASGSMRNEGGELKQINATVARHMRSARERGPGIAAKPPQPEPAAFLDEDLLCEDA